MYRKYRNKLNSLLKKAEREHYESLLHCNQNFIKKSWSIIKTVINKKKSNTISDRFLINGNTVTDKNVIVGAFNKYYVNIGPTLARNMAPALNDPVSYIKFNAIQSMYVNPVDKREFSNIIDLLKDTSAGYDGISTKVVKRSYQHYLPVLNHIMNLSLSQGVFPNQLKVAKVIPLFKSGDKMLVNNYRPVSVLSIFSKILEKIMYERIIRYLKGGKYYTDINLGLEKNTALILL
jgi:hypothetical protein